ncbi:MAG: ThiF family adenylyltransferase [Planctomycetota bacterium]|jgi:molybdopterin/thiamine biosynthesis adenylyltransferase
MKKSTALLTSVRYVTNGIKSDDPDERVTDRQERVQGFDQSVMSELRVNAIGGGGLGGDIIHGLVRKGVGSVRIFDADTVSITNLTRQRFYPEDLYKNKALCLAKNLSKEAVGETEIIAYPIMIQRAVQDGIDLSCDIVVCAPDNNETRIFASRYFGDKTPVIFTGLDIQANTGYVFVQVPWNACIGCALPRILNKRKSPCPKTPAVIDLIKIIAGFVLFAIDSTLMERKKSWNFRQIFLDGDYPGFTRSVERDKNCPLCSGIG